MTKRIATPLHLGLALVLTAAACAGEPEREVPADVATTAEPIGTAVPPDTTAEGIWAHLAEARYQDTWRLWPGKDRLYAGVEPHGMLLTTYVNDVAYQALAAGSTDLPAGSVVVKENYMPDSTFAAVTTMYRVPGYNPEHQDWFFAKHDPAGVVDVAGRDPMCQACHASAPGSDYLYTELPR